MAHHLYRQAGDQSGKPVIAPIRIAFLAASWLGTASLHAQFDLQDSHTTASLRGIDTVSQQVAWASGSGGTILHTEDAGQHWQICNTPAGAEKLDFRGVQASDAKTAIIMSSGKGNLSRIFKTTDSCLTWRLVFTDPDADGFFDTIRRVTARQFFVLGDPVQGRFAMFLSRDAGDTWSIADDPGLDAEKGDGAFAASNSSLIALGPTLYFGTGGTNAAHVYGTHAAACPSATANSQQQSCPIAWIKADVPVASHAAAAGVFSLAGRTESSSNGTLRAILVAVGGTYDKPQDGSASAATSLDGGKTWLLAATPPGGYRSAVAFDREAGVWIAVGTSGADLSRDDGKTWSPLPPGHVDPSAGAPGWNAIALPYIVGSKGRIARLLPDSLKP